jgi:hypothetical protein
MQAVSRHQDYPLLITRDEERVGFELLHLFRLVDPKFEDQWTEVVGKVLGSSDVVLKVSLFDGVAYSHRRYGVISFQGDPMPVPPEWVAVGMPYYTVDHAVIESSIGASEVDGPEVIPTPAEIRRPEQDETQQPP